MGTNESIDNGRAFLRFCGTRARMQRVADMRFATGWIVNIGPGSAAIKVNESSNWSPGDTLFVQAYGVGECLSFGGQILSFVADVATLRIEGDTKVSASDEKTRHLVEGLKCHLKLGWFEAETEVLDVSTSGLALKTAVQVPKGESAELTIHTHFGDVLATATAKYCRKFAGGGETFRIGFELKTVDRLSEAKWRMAIDGLAGRSTANR